MFTGLSRQTTLVSSEGGSVDNIGYKKKQEKKSEEFQTRRNKQYNKVEKGKKNRSGHCSFIHCTCHQLFTSNPRCCYYVHKKMP